MVAAATPGSAFATLCLRRSCLPASGLRALSCCSRRPCHPERYYANTLGIPPETVWLQIEPPFSSDQLTVRIVDHVSTRFHRRAKSLEPITGLIGEQIHREPGNYLAFFSSFDYLESAKELFAQKFPGVPVWSQSRDMSEKERAAFLSAFIPGGSGVGFAVLGGAFAEGVDLPGDRLGGVFIASRGSRRRARSTK